MSNKWGYPTFASCTPTRDVLAQPGPMGILAAATAQGIWAATLQTEGEKNIRGGRGRNMEGRRGLQRLAPCKQASSGAGEVLFREHLEQICQNCQNRSDWWNLNWGAKGLLRCVWLSFTRLKIDEIPICYPFEREKYKSMRYSRSGGLKWWAEVLVSPGIQLIFFLVAMVWIHYDNNVDNTPVFWLLLSSANPKSRTAGLNW